MHLRSIDLRSQSTGQIQSDGILSNSSLRQLLHDEFQCMDARIESVFIISVQDECLASSF